MSGQPRSFRFERADLCWPLLFHVEPIVSAYRWKTAFTVIVTDEQGVREYPTVAQAQAGSRERPPHRVELYATYTEASGFKIGMWVVGFGPDQQPAATLQIDQGLESEAEELRAAVAEFLDEEEPAAVSAGAQPAASAGRLHWLTEQPLGVTIVGGVVATLLAAGIVALVSLLF
jgi:hypothetical protein